MKARWVLHNPSPKAPMVGYAIVAKWWPGRYFLAMTFLRDSSSSLDRLTQSISCGDAAPSLDGYLTQVFRCNKEGVVYSIEKPLYERKYSELSAACDGHKEIVELL